MNKAKHTPGPWRIIGADGHATGIWGPEAEDVVAGCAPIDQANARLIAAAPDLLEALEAALSHLAGTNWSNRQSNVYTMARDAIAKARGEP